MSILSGSRPGARTFSLRGTRADRAIERDGEVLRVQRSTLHRAGPDEDDGAVVISGLAGERGDLVHGRGGSTGGERERRKRVISKVLKVDVEHYVWDGHRSVARKAAGAGASVQCGNLPDEVCVPEDNVWERGNPDLPGFWKGLIDDRERERCGFRRKLGRIKTWMVDSYGHLASELDQCHRRQDGPRSKKTALGVPCRGVYDTVGIGGKQGESGTPEYGGDRRAGDADEILGHGRPSSHKAALGIPCRGAYGTVGIGGKQRESRAPRNGGDRRARHGDQIIGHGCPSSHKAALGIPCRRAYGTVGIGGKQRESRAPRNGGDRRARDADEIIGHGRPSSHKAALRIPCRGAYGTVGIGGKQRESRAPRNGGDRRARHGDQIFGHGGPSSHKAALGFPCRPAYGTVLIGCKQRQSPAP